MFITRLLRHASNAQSVGPTIQNHARVGLHIGRAGGRCWMGYPLIQRARHLIRHLDGVERDSPTSVALHSSSRPFPVNNSKNYRPGRRPRSLPTGSRRRAADLRSETRFTRSTCFLTVPVSDSAEQPVEQRQSDQRRSGGDAAVGRLRRTVEEAHARPQRREVRSKFTTRSHSRR